MKKQARELTPKGSVEQGRRGQAHRLKDGALEGRSDEGLLEQRQGKGGEVDDSEASPNEAELQSGCRGGGKGKASDARWPGLLFGGRLACLVVLSQSVQLGTEQTGYISSGSRNSLREKKRFNLRKNQLLLARNSVTSQFGSSPAPNVHFQFLEVLLVLYIPCITII